MKAIPRIASESSEDDVTSMFKVRALLCVFYCSTFSKKFKTLITFCDPTPFIKMHNPWSNYGKNNVFFCGKGDISLTLLLNQFETLNLLS